MDLLGNDTKHLLLLPAAFVLQNELAASDGYNTTNTTYVVPNQTGANWKEEETALGEPRRLDKIGDVIRKELKWTFILHAYGFGCLFFILAFYTFFSILNIRSFISSRPFMSTINGFLCLLGASRATSLFIDPYNLKENMPRLFGQVLWDLGLPSIISAFSLVQLAFVQFTQFRVGAEGLRRKSCLSLMVTAHFLLTIAVDIVVASHENLMALKHVVHYIFLTWGVFLCSNFLYGGYKIMSMMKSFPEGLKHNHLPEAGYKGIMQLAMLAPQNNLAGSMTAALLPALGAPKIHHQDNGNLSFVGFKNDGNSRILESESIPMLEELTGSSADEACSKPLVRASSLPNQKRSSQKFNPKAKSCSKSRACESKDEESPPVRRTGSGKSSTKTTALRANDSDLSKRKVNFITGQSSRLFREKLHRRTCFQSDHFSFANEKTGRQSDNLIPDILVSCPGSSETVEANARDGRDDLASELSKDLTEMHILREGASNKSEEVAEVHSWAGKTCHGQGKSNLSDTNKSSERPKPSTSDEALIEDPSRKELPEFEEIQPASRRLRSRRKERPLSWKKKEEEEATRECLLLHQRPTDAALSSVLNHLTYLNRGTAKGASCENDPEKVLKSKVEWVLNMTYITAMWGLMLCLSYMGKIYISFGLPEPRKTVSRLNPPTQSQGGTPTESLQNGIIFSSWPWLWFQTFCRALELAMGCAMANITRQPAANARHSPSLIFRRRDIFYNI